MSNAKHTPGPWRIDRAIAYDDGDNGMSAVSISGDGWGEFAKCLVKFDDEDPPEGQANARLIAAAPDLLSALERLEMVSGLALMSDDPARMAARAAIAKAKGE